MKNACASVTIAVFIMLFDWSLQEFFKIMSTNGRRVITSFLGGLGVGMFIWTGAKFAFFQTWSYFTQGHLSL